MLGKTHMAVGIAATLAITQPSGVSELVLAVGAGSLLLVVVLAAFGLLKQKREFLAKAGES